MNGKEVRALSDEEIKSELARLRDKLFGMRTQGVTEKVEDNSSFLKSRRDIARLLTERTARIQKTHGKADRKVEAKAETKAPAKTAAKTTSKAASKTAGKGKTSSRLKKVAAKK